MNACLARAHVLGHGTGGNTGVPPRISGSLTIIVFPDSIYVPSVWSGYTISVLWTLARRSQKVFLSADALGLLADLLRARRAPALARARAHEEVARRAAGQHDGAARPLRFDHRVSVAARRRSGLAC